MFKGSRVQVVKELVRYILIFAVALIVGGYLVTVLTSSRGKAFLAEGEDIQDIHTYTEDGSNMVRIISNSSNYTFTALPSQPNIYIVNYDPYGRHVVFTGYALLAIVLLIKLRRIDWKVISGAILLAVVYFISRYRSPEELPSILQSPWLFAHVTTIMTSYALFVIMAFRPTVNILQWGVTLLTIGTMLGSVWADTAWGAYWSWDPKETWALITLIIYAVPLLLKGKTNPPISHLKSPISHLPSRLYYIVALISVIITYFGVNYLFGGMHSYR